MKEIELPAPQDDGHLIDIVGDWALQKHHFLRRYIRAFTVAMRKKKWSGLHYIDLFAGPGLHRIEGSGELIWGSPLLSFHLGGFDAYHLCEDSASKYDALNLRVGQLAAGANSKVKLYRGDGNAQVFEVIANLPAGCLVLAFLDPYGLHLRFDTLRALSAHRADLIIFFPDHLDALRNMDFVYRDKPDSNLDLFLGPGADWRGATETTPNYRWAEVLRKLYVANIKRLGYSEFAYERITGPSGPLYQLIFCSHHPAGSKIWRGISMTKPDGQRSFDFPD